jgi:hypothetical protein
MAEEGIVVESGVSWLHDKLRTDLEARKEYLMEAIATGLPQEEYRQFVGRYRECKRQLDELGELFADFYQNEDADEDDLGEIDE